MRVLARDGVAKVQSITAPLLVGSFVLVLAVHIPHVGVSVNGARRWIGPGSFQFEPSELMKLALVLYAATLLAKRPQRVHDLRELANPLLLVVGGGVPARRHPARPGHGDGDRVHDGALLIAAGIPLRKLAILAGGRWAGVPVRARAPYAGRG
jgi:cell division protein FtsW